MKLKDFLKEFYGNKPVALKISNLACNRKYCGDGHKFYENALTDIPEEFLEGFKVLAIYPYSTYYIGVLIDEI